jgi:hypothetical protein
MPWVVGEFKATSADGTECTIEIWQHTVTEPAFGGLPTRTDVRQSLRTKQGQHVSYVDKGKYRITLSGEALTSADPDAP